MILAFGIIDKISSIRFFPPNTITHVPKAIDGVGTVLKVIEPISPPFIWGTWARGRRKKRTCAHTPAVIHRVRRFCVEKNTNGYVLQQKVSNKQRRWGHGYRNKKINLRRFQIKRANLHLICCDTFCLLREGTKEGDGRHIKLHEFPGPRVCHTVAAIERHGGEHRKLLSTKARS
jgi:hypothetical protein